MLLFSGKKRTQLDPVDRRSSYVQTTAYDILATVGYNLMRQLQTATENLYSLCVLHF
jgi:hypothetical protein